MRLRAVTVNQAISMRTEPLVADRLRRAGVRLGHLLNLTLGQ